MPRLLHAMAAVSLAALPVLAGAPAAAQQGYSDAYTFLKAVRDRDGAEAQRIVDDPSSTAINARDPKTGESALHILVRGRDSQWLRFLLSRGARPDVHDGEGSTPLGLAAQIGWGEGAEQLIAAGASVNLGNARGETPLILAVQRRDVPVVRLLLAAGADPNQSDTAAGYSAIDHARRDRRSAVILRLLEEGPKAQREIAGPPR